MKWVDERIQRWLGDYEGLLRQRRGRNRKLSGKEMEIRLTTWHNLQIRSCHPIKAINGSLLLTTKTL